ncbi:hypothetical protein AB0H92_02595 [Streptomyces phaeochromogenes]|uniref:hypothetical protein n=1 Tax=Streptomyces phaeochromogenes TaxID=1923 RepID=UPI0033EE7DD5
MAPATTALPNAPGQLYATPAAASPAASRGATKAERTRTLDQLYRAALTEGGNLVVHAGGDTPTRQDGMW